MAKKPVKADNFTFEHLAESIRQAHKEFVAQTSRAINVGLTLRNWLIGCYIAEYELNGSDHAEYGAALLDKLSLSLIESGVKGCARRQLYSYLRFYKAYPQIVQSVTALSGNKSADVVNQLSYTHIEQLLGLEDDMKRAFYEGECMRGNWSVRELKRQIGSLYYERSGLSHDKKKPVKNRKSVIQGKFIGMWKDREDTSDSSVFVKNMRKEHWGQKDA